LKLLTSGVGGRCKRPSSSSFIRVLDIDE